MNDFTKSSSANQNPLEEVIDSNRVEEGSEPNVSDLEADLVDGCGELTAFDSGIAGSFREHTGSSDVDVKEGLLEEKDSMKQPNLIDRAELLIMQAERGKICDNIDSSMEKFTTEMNLVNNNLFNLFL